ncbi:daxx-like protein isoform X1 [Temnothorax americanus]|uniref:daxx-like protein isoform X1 n=2 Tax=Temnothorax americanus TaxID=1964332 RepID=UPI0040691A0F
MKMFDRMSLHRLRSHRIIREALSYKCRLVWWHLLAVSNLTMEVICISSDDESDSQKENKDKLPTKSTETGIGAYAHGKTETLFIDIDKTEENNLKRKKLQTGTNVIIWPDNIMEKKRRLNLDQGTSKVINKSVPSQCSINVPEIEFVKSDCNAKLNKNLPDQEVTTEKIQLIVKEKKKISYVSQDVFPLFISLCLQKCPKNDKRDMDKIVDKLKRRYENLDPIYAASENFVTFLNEKREAITSNSKKMYVHIEEVMNEMRVKKSQALQNNKIYDAVPSTSYATNNVPVNIEVESSDEDDADNEENENSETRRRIKEVTKAMEKCERRIKKLEEKEVDFNEENDSNYIKVERYKEKMVELYDKFCELTGENADAGRVYLRPKHFNVTRIVAVDQAITNFINSKITRRNQMKKTGTLVDDLIFPDHRDILECVNRCNDRKKLGLDEKQREKLARKAFEELGEHLQRSRRKDYWDTFSLYLEDTEEDPAIKDENLAKKLTDNRIEGEKRLAAVFEEYVKKQFEMKDENNEEASLEEEDEDEEIEEESIIDDEDKNDENSSMTSENDSDNEEDIDKTVKENRSPTEKNKSNISVHHAVDKAISNKTMADTLQQKCNKLLKIKVLKNNDAAVSKNENKTINEKTIHEPYSSSTILKDVVKEMTQEDSPAGLTTECTSEDLAEVEAIEVSEVITNPATKKVTKDVTDTITGVTTELIIGNAAELITGDAAELMTDNAAELITEDVTEEITENTTEIITNETEIITESVMDEPIENIPNDEQPEEEKKPVLRLRSFAKPPTTWEDNQHKMDKTAEEYAPKITNQNKEIIDLTNEGTAKPSPVVAKRTVLAVGNKIIPKIIPVMKRQTLVRCMPTNSNIISVQNITNNYLKVNMRTGQIAPVRDVRGSTIIQLPLQSTSRQSQQNANAGNETIVINRIVPSKIISIKKSTVQSVSKETDVSSPTTKSK